MLLLFHSQIMFDHLAKFRYRADIDGLRAIAVIGVVLFHAGLGVSGGFVGVDVFFVISGFLITSLILRDLHRGSFSIVDFWERRARRIFPALAVVVIVTLIAGWFLMLPFGFQVLGQSAVALTSLPPIFSSGARLGILIQQLKRTLYAYLVSLCRRAVLPDRSSCYYAWFSLYAFSVGWDLS